MTVTERAPIGRTLGPISVRSAGSSVLPSTGDGFDFALAGLGFHVAARDELPYERETAEFRKDQFDNSPVVGEQSLGGWWLRSQMSFHKGAGIKFYDTLGGGEEVLDRFQDSQGVDPRTPGEVSLAAEDVSYNTSSLTDLADGRKGRSEPLAGVTGGGVPVLLSGASTTNLTPVTAGTVRGVASNGDRTFFATAGGIEQVQAAGSTLSSLWTASVALHNVWWVKNRLFTVDTAGDWWAVPDTGGTLDASQRFWSSGRTSGLGSWSVADTPAAVMAAQRNIIYAIGLDADGVVPTIVSGVVAAELPNDEFVNDITYSLGQLVISTTKGIRLALVQGSEVVFGPLVVTGNADTSAVTGTTVHVGCTLTDGRAGVVDLDLSQAVTDLTAAWHMERELTVATATPRVVAPAAGEVYALTDLGVRKTTANRTDTGYLLTGNHRFGTIEPKAFRTVKVRVGGTGGTIAISRIVKGGGEVPLYTIGVTGDFEDDITLGLPDPQEYVALRFTLTRDQTDHTLGPVLLGYQLRAMPAPRRQRILTVPLLCFDTERGASGLDRGHEGWAWERLAALEARENDGAVYTYQDFRTGETGAAYIESVRFLNRTPPSGRSSGFGGYIVLRLRAVN